MNNISIFGTSSDSGKSTLTFVLGKIIQENGFNAAPFKAQNVSNNANVADDGSEISIAQHFQASVMNVPTSYHLNPVLLKSGSGNSTSIIIEGKPLETKDVRSYYRDLDSLKPIVKNAFEYMNSKYDCVIAEGAGSPVELNLMDKDLSNIFIADTFNTKIILVADIEKSGVFASIYGVANLLPPKLKKNLAGVIINKFRGDKTLFDNGVKIIEKDFGLPVFGVLPYKTLNLGFEDSQSLMNYHQIKDIDYSKRIAVIAYPTMSNYNDLEPLIANDSIHLEFIKGNRPLNDFDEIILPGSKLVINDLIWLKKTGLFKQLQNLNVPITGICGGYQMMFNKLKDLDLVETSQITEIDGLGFIDDDIIFRPHKILKRDDYNIFGKNINGFEMHHGISEKYPLSYENGLIRGTFVHSLFDDEDFIKIRTKIINDFTDEMRMNLDVQRIMDNVS
jgi:adenosylcobyric acid synthase